MCQCRVIGCSDVIVCKFHIIFICCGVMQWIASEIYGFLLMGQIIKYTYIAFKESKFKFKNKYLM